MADGNVAVLDPLECERLARVEREQNGLVAANVALCETDATAWLIAAVKDLRARVYDLETENAALRRSLDETAVEKPAKEKGGKAK